MDHQRKTDCEKVSLIYEVHKKDIRDSLTFLKSDYKVHHLEI